VRNIVDEIDEIVEVEDTNKVKLQASISSYFKKDKTKSSQIMSSFITPYKNNKTLKSNTTPTNSADKKVNNSPDTDTLAKSNTLQRTDKSIIINLDEALQKEAKELKEVRNISKYPTLQIL